MRQWFHTFIYGASDRAWFASFLILYVIGMVIMATFGAGCSATRYEHVKPDGERLAITDQTFFHARSVETAKFVKGDTTLEVNGGKTNTDAAETLKAAADLAKNLRPSP
jgi:hypothetical protein